MCARYNLEAAELRWIGRMAQTILLQNQGITKPGFSAQVIYNCQDRPLAGRFRWGWPKPWDSGLVINARAETALAKGFFRDAVLQTRCLVPITRFLERNRAGQFETFTPTDSSLITLGGIWTRTTEGAAFVIITTAPSPVVAPIHDRMPLIIQPADREAWLDPNASLLTRSLTHWHDKTRSLSLN